MSSSHLHTIVIKDVDKQSVKRVKVPERIKETYSTQTLMIQIKDTSSCHGIMVKYDSDFDTSTNQKKPRTMMQYIALSMGMTDKVLRDLIENKDQLLELYVRQLLEHNIHFNELDFTQKQLQFEVFLKDPADIGDTVDTCLKPLNSWLVPDESKSSGFKPTQTLFDRVGVDKESPGQERLFCDQGLNPRKEESVTMGIEKCPKEEDILDGNDSKSAGKECYAVTTEEHIEESIDQEKLVDGNSEEKEKPRDKFESEEFKARKGLENSGTGKSPSQVKVVCDEDIDSFKTVLKEKVTTSARKGRETQDFTDIVNLSGQEKDFGGNDSGSNNSVIFRDTIGDDTDGFKFPLETVRKTPTFNSSMDKSELKVAEQNSRNVIANTFMPRREYIIEGDDQDQEIIVIKEMDMTRKILDIMMRQVISGQSKVLQRCKEVYVNLLSHVSTYFYYKYHYYDVKSTPEELTLLLVAVFNEEKDAKQSPGLRLDNTQLNHDRRFEDCTTATRYKRYRNEKSKKWAGEIAIKDSDKSGRLSPEGSNEIEEGLEPLKNEKGPMEPTDAELKARVMGKLGGDASQPHFIDDDTTPETDGDDFPTSSLESPEGGGRPDDGGPIPDSRDPLGSGSSPSDVDLSGDRSRENSSDEDDESDDDSDEDVWRGCPGVRTVPEGYADSGGGAAMGAVGGEPSLSDRSHQAFLDSWNVNLEDNGKKCLYSALKDCNSEQEAAPSTMFLLDLSKSMQQEDKISQMKTEVRSILQVAGSKHHQVPETYGVAVFGHNTEVLLYPTIHLHEVLDTLDKARFNKPGGRSPLGLGLILCTCVWFSEKGTGGTVWLHGRKVKPRIIVITDMKFNDTVRGAGGMEEDQDTLESGDMNTVKNELVKIALKLKKLEIPVFLVPIGDITQVRSHFEALIKMTGGLLEKNGEQLGRQTWQQITACNLMHLFENDLERSNLSDEAYQLILESYTADDPGDKEIVTRIMMERKERERKEDDIRSLIQWTGEPGEQLWKDLPFGERVQVAELTGTVVGHLPEKRILVQWDNSPTGELECRVMADLSRGTPRYCGEYLGETHLVGSRVRRIHHAIGEDGVPRITMDATEGTVVTLSTLQPSIVYVVWNGDPILVRRHSSLDICRFTEKDHSYEYDWYWLFCDNGQWQPFPREISKSLEKTTEKNPQAKTFLITLTGKYNGRYRILFSRNHMRRAEQKQGPVVRYPILRQAIPR